MSSMRSLLSASPTSLERALDSDADLVILDLEGTTDGIKQNIQLPSTSRLYLKLGLSDCERLMETGMASPGNCFGGILLAKVESRETLQAADALVSHLEDNIDRTMNSIDLLPLMETPAGIENAGTICDGIERVTRLAFGAGDYCRALRLRRTPEETELHDAREALVAVSRSLSIEMPIDTPFPYTEDIGQFRRIAERSRDMGYQGKICIHLDQVPLANMIFTADEPRS